MPLECRAVLPAGWWRSLGWDLPVPLPAPAALLMGGRCRPQRPWGSSSLPHTRYSGVPELAEGRRSMRMEAHILASSSSAGQPSSSAPAAGCSYSASSLMLRTACCRRAAAAHAQWVRLSPKSAVAVEACTFIVCYYEEPMAPSASSTNLCWPERDGWRGSPCLGRICQKETPVHHEEMEDAHDSL